MEKRDADAMCECGYDDDEGDYITREGLCLDCSAYMHAYDCTPDCRTRAQCWEEGPTHTLCGTCFNCFRPNHHCNCKENN